MNRLYIGGFHPALEDAFCACCRELRRRGLDALRVIVPHPLLGRYLSRLLAARQAAPFNVHFLALDRQLREWAELELERTGLTMLSPPAEEVLFNSVIRNLQPELPRLAPLLETKGLRNHLRSWIAECAEAGFTAEWLRRLRPPPDRTPEMQQATETLKIARAWRRELESRRLTCQADVPALALATLRGRRNDRGSMPLLIYGIYQFTPLHKAIVEELLASGETHIFFPWRELAAYEFARPMLDWLRQRLACETCAESDGALPAGLAAIRGADLFRAQAPAAGETDCTGIEIFSAPHSDVECGEILRRAQEAAGGHCALWEQAVICRMPAALYPHWRDATARGGFSSWIQGGAPLPESSAARALQLLLCAARQRFARRPTLEFLKYAPLRLLQDRSPARRAQIRADWEQLSSAAGRRRLHPAALENLTCASDAFDRPANPAEAADAPDTFARELRRESRGLLAQLARALQPLDCAPDELARPSEISGRIQTVFAELIDPGAEQFAAVNATVAECAALDEYAAAIRFDELLELLLGLLQSRRAPRGRYERDGLAFCGIRLSYGVTWRNVSLPDLIEGAYERPGAVNRLIGDAERRWINQRARELAGENSPAPELQPDGRRVLEERLLFQFALESARGKLTLSYSRLHGARNRAQLPAEALNRLCAGFGATGDADAAQSLENFPAYRRIELDQVCDARPGRNVLPRQFDLALARACAAPDAAAQYLLRVCDGLGRGARLDRARMSPRYSEFDGLILNDQALSALQQHRSPFRNPVSASQLEDYCACPFRFLLGRLLRLEQPLNPDERRTSEPVEEGGLLHRIYQEFYSRLKQADAFPLAAGAAAARAREELRATAERLLRDFELRHDTGFPLLWDARRGALWHDLFAHLQAELERNEDWRPLDFEIEFSRTGALQYGLEFRPLRLEFGDGRSVELRGKIDRVDVRGDAQNCRHLRVIDYKTGRARTSGEKDPRAPKKVFYRGRQLQLPLYLLAAEAIYEHEELDGAEFVYATRKGNFEHHPFDAGVFRRTRPLLLQLIRAICDNWERGIFIQTPGTACDYCAFRGGPCEDGREFRAAQKKQDAPAAAIDRITELDDDAREIAAAE